MSVVRLLVIMELSFPRTFAPRSESSIGGTFVAWNFRSLELSFPGAKTTWNFRCPPISPNPISPNPISPNGLGLEG